MMPLSIGDRVRPGAYTLWARFRRSAVFMRDNEVVCLVAEDLDGGPLNIVFRDFDSPAARCLVVADASIEWGACRWSAAVAERPDSVLRLSASSACALRARWDSARTRLARQAAPESMAFVLDLPEEPATRAPFEAALRRQLQAGADRVRRGDLAAGIALLKGCGRGLTPAGDDFMAGVLLGLHLLEQAGAGPYAKVRQGVLDAARGGNPLANAFLEMAAQGRAARPLQRLAAALADSDNAALDTALNGQLAMGATSGADLLVGLLVALEREDWIWP